MSLRIHRLACVLTLAGCCAWAEGVTIQFANAVAAQSYQMKRTAFVFRVLGCEAESRAEVTAKAEGRLDGNRRSIPLKVASAAAPNVFGIFREWPGQGVWLVSVTARCSSKTAGALVAADESGLNRESSIALDHAASESEVETALKRGKKPAGSID